MATVQENHSAYESVQIMSDWAEKKLTKPGYWWFQDGDLMYYPTIYLDGEVDYIPSCFDMSINDQGVVSELFLSLRKVMDCVKAHPKTGRDYVTTVYCYEVKIINQEYGLE
jgi:hypothetical protein